MSSNPLKFLKIGIIVYLVYAAVVLAVGSQSATTPDEMEWEDRQRFNRIHIGKLELGDTRKHIVTELGSPDISEAKQVNNTTLSLLFYRTQHVSSDGKTTKDECTSLLFKDGLLVAWGQPAIDMYQTESNYLDVSQRLLRENTAPPSV